MINKLKIIIGILALFSLLFGQCACPYSGNNPEGAFGRHEFWTTSDTQIDLTDEWQTINEKWDFKDGGELTITSPTQTTNAYWIDGKNTLEIIIDGKSTVYNVEVLSSKKLRLSTADKEIFLSK